jgi:hypothetical protein
MIRFSAVVIALLALTATTVVGISPASAQGNSAQGASAVDRCIAKCKAGGTWKHCDKWCEDRARR